MATKRFKLGKWRFRVTRKNVIDRPIYATFDSEAEGDLWAEKCEAMLDRGIIPPEFHNSEKGVIKKRSLLKDVIVHAIANGHVSRSDESILEIIARRHATTLISSIDYRWAERWLQHMKRVEHLSPTTIRHHVGALARCLDNLAKRGDMDKNPLRLLSRGYSTYSKADIQALPEGKQARVDQQRDRRLEETEEENIRKILAGEVIKAGTPRLALPAQAALELLFDWALESAMRLSEMYTLEKSQVDLKKKTLFLDKTKNGDKRQIPMTTPAIAAYKVYLKHVKDGTRGMGAVEAMDHLVFPFWDGVRSKESTNRATAKLSAQFARIFDAAGCPDIRFHDLRHEATSRFFERSKLSDIEIAKVTGHRSPAMLMRYANLRGSELAGRLW